MNTITVYTDGASRGNPGPGGWAAIIVSNDKVVELAGGVRKATNNQMELQGVIEALNYIYKNSPDSTVLLHADSAYVLNGLSSWLDGWVRNNWITSTKKAVENREQWEELLELRTKFKNRLELVKVKGHSGHNFNDRCDELAVSYALGKNIDLFSGNLSDYTVTSDSSPKKVVKKTKNKETAYSYVSLVDGKVFVDKNWDACEKRVKGKKGAKFKKVFSKAEETALIQDYTLHSLL
jgi:ribonuclease HI